MNKKQNRIRLIKCTSILILAVFVVTAFARGKQDSKQNETTKSSERFDLIVREDFFAGMMGDVQRLNHGMKLCEEVLSKNPKHAGALVWHGGGLITRASGLYAAGDTAQGDKLWQQGLEEMNNAVVYEPENMGVKIGRAATLIGLSQSGWDPSDKEARVLLTSAVTDYEKVYQSQKATFDKIPLHSRGELLFGLASGWSILGDTEKARFYLELVIDNCKDSRYQKEAEKLLALKEMPTVDHNCSGCHASANR